MRLPALVVTGSLLVLAGLAGAGCSSAQPLNGSSPDDEGNGNGTPTTAPTRVTATSNTCLGKVGLDFEKPTCNTCMSADGCCQATITCFKDNADCSGLQDCMAACGGGGTGTGGGTGGGDGGGTTSAAMTLFATEVYPAVSGTCAGCHAQTGPGPQFFGTTAELTYPMFKIAGFDKANSGFVNKGAHEGPALTATQKTTLTKWVTAEAAGGGTGTGTGGGTGMGGGTGTADGGGAGTGTGGGKAACQTACKAKFPAAVDKWSAYNTCVSSTCGSSCL